MTVSFGRTHNYHPEKPADPNWQLGLHPDDVGEPGDRGWKRPVVAKKNAVRYPDKGWETRITPKFISSSHESIDLRLCLGIRDEDGLWKGIFFKGLPDPSTASAAANFANKPGLNEKGRQRLLMIHNDSMLAGGLNTGNGRQPIETRVRASHLRLVDATTHPKDEMINILDFVDWNDPENMRLVFKKLFRHDTPKELAETQSLLHGLAMYAANENRGRAISDPSLTEAMARLMVRLFDFSGPALNTSRLNRTHFHDKEKGFPTSLKNHVFCYAPEEIYRAFAPDFLKWKKEDRIHVSQLDSLWNVFDCGIHEERQSTGRLINQWWHEPNWSLNPSKLMENEKFMAWAKRQMYNWDDLIVPIAEGAKRMGFATAKPSDITPAMLDRAASVAYRKSRYAHLVRTFDVIRKQLEGDPDYLHTEISSRTAKLVESYPAFIQLIAKDDPPPTRSEIDLATTIANTAELRNFDSFLQKQAGYIVDNKNQYLGFDPMNCAYRDEENLKAGEYEKPTAVSLNPHVVTNVQYVTKLLNEGKGKTAKRY